MNLDQEVQDDKVSNFSDSCYTCVSQCDSNGGGQTLSNDNVLSGLANLSSARLKMAMWAYGRGCASAPLDTYVKSPDLRALTIGAASDALDQLTYFFQFPTCFRKNTPKQTQVEQYGSWSNRNRVRNGGVMGQNKE